MKVGAFLDILEKIKAQYASSNKVRRRIADLILENPAKCCFYSLKEFASAASTTQVTVLNFCRDLEIGSFVDLKKGIKLYSGIYYLPFWSTLAMMQELR